MSRIEPGMNAPAILPGTVSPSRTDRAPRTDRSDQKVMSSGDDVVTAQAAPDSSRIGLFQAVNHDMQSVATTTRSSKEMLDALAKNLGGMKDELFHIIKNYPPFSPEDKARVQFLRTFNGLRQEIDRLTIPPEATWSGTDTPSTPSAPAAGNGVGAAINSIPILPEMASDPAVQDTANTVDTALATITARQTELGRDAAIQQTRGSDVKIAAFQSAAPGGLEIATLPEAKAETISLEVKQSFIRNPSGTGMTNMQLLAQMVG
jgi:hypothetical protein